MPQPYSIQVEPGERKLLPIDHRLSGSYQLTCIRGHGFLRVMSCSTRLKVRAGDSIAISARDIATLTARDPMAVMLIEN
ncbi:MULTISPECIES: hypothetical protein [unclassified Motilimonas]|uniref:hypothetical protein n=1 Tax=Motilimonas TaxID=1914248 RepID=UPI001E572FD1|nr:MULTISPECIES: hypothetical protein [unclassified Motilimonas]MCE0559136.1 hypothetical protein [Motilimonas sp. E26]MDO6525345.1 hypothetical protein [Motilimonas sp. 1_MG-2023]